jgi:hypothetical protein
MDPTISERISIHYSVMVHNSSEVRLGCSNEVFRWLGRCEPEEKRNGGGRVTALGSEHH